MEAGGICISPEWNHFSVFLLDMGPVPCGYTLERINVDGNYEPLNCRWASRKEQANNRRSNIWLDVDGTRMTVRQAAKHYGFPEPTLYGAIRRGMQPNIALNFVMRKRVCNGN